MLYRRGNSVTLCDGGESGDQTVIGHHSGHQFRTGQLNAQHATTSAMHGTELVTNFGQEFCSEADQHIAMKVVLDAVPFDLLAKMARERGFLETPERSQAVAHKAEGRKDYYGRQDEASGNEVAMHLRNNIMHFVPYPPAGALEKQLVPRRPAQSTQRERRTLLYSVVGA